MIIQIHVFCLIYGIIMFTIWPTYLILGPVNLLPHSVCIIETLILLYMEDYMLVLLPTLSLERLISIYIPFGNESKKRWFLTILTIIMITAVAALICTPMIPTKSKSKLVSTNITEIITCDAWETCGNYLHLNKEVLPVIILEVICLVTVIAVYIALLISTKLRIRKR